MHVLTKGITCVDDCNEKKNIKTSNKKNVLVCVCVTSVYDRYVCVYVYVREFKSQRRFKKVNAPQRQRSYPCATTCEMQG